MDATWSGRRRTRALPPSVGCHPTCPSAHHSPHTPHPPTHHRNTYSNDDSWAVLTDQKVEEKMYSYPSGTFFKLGSESGSYLI